MTTKELQEKIIENMRAWQKIEKATVTHTGSIMDRSQNPVVRTVMEIVQRDSQMHHRVQQLVIDSLEKQAVLSPDELGEIWELIEAHQEMEQKTLDYARESLEALKGRKMLVQEYLLNFLRMDEEKHVMLLAALEKIKRGMYPYA
jgi:uncharacterized protein with von Willebrand factor type A (vWA) domain